MIELMRSTRIPMAEDPKMEEDLFNWSIQEWKLGTENTTKNIDKTNRPSSCFKAKPIIEEIKEESKDSLPIRKGVLERKIVGVIDSFRKY